MSRAPALTIRDNPSRQRFETEVDGSVSYAEYQLGDGTIAFTHTLVPEALRGRGIATQLVEAALESARAQHRGVIPHCSMFAVYMQQHPETHALLAPAGRALLRL
ncbi:MAG TPA: GNAT family N-acetyltransferase [Steroidobacteraceae bacterium]|nr:GNAT family N-acetyltransferase [Steroidobacteraceae bacterium]